MFPVASIVAATQRRPAGASDPMEGSLFLLHSSSSLGALNATTARASLATYEDASGIVRTSSAGVIRTANYNGGNRTILLEGPGENLALYSETFDPGTWITHGGDGGATTLTPAAAVAPDGEFTAARLSNSGSQTNPLFGILQFVQGDGAVPHSVTFSIWAKAGTLSQAFICVCDYNSDTPLAGGVVELTAFWQRFEFSSETSGGFPGLCRIQVATNGVAGSILIWGAQCEQRAFASSYIPTTDETAPRAGDTLTFPCTFPVQPLTVFWRGAPSGSTNYNRLVAIGYENPSSIAISHVPPNPYGAVDFEAVDNSGTYHTGNNGTILAIADKLEACFVFDPVAKTFSGLMAVNGIARADSSGGTGNFGATFANGIISLTGLGDGTEKPFVALRDLVVVEGARDIEWFRERLPVGAFDTCWGDSLTIGAGGVPYPAQMQVKTKRLTFNEGIGGETSTQVAIRQGGVVATATIDGGAIPSSGGVEVTFPAGFEPITTQVSSQSIAGSLAGVPGLVTLDSGVFTFTRTDAGSSIAAASAPLLVDTRGRNAGDQVIWVGRNNINALAQVQSDVAAMVAFLGHSRYRVLSVINALDEPAGSANYIAIAAINSALSATYGGRFLDVRAYLVSKYDPDIPQDVTDHTNDTPPTSLRSDNYHLNTAGYGWVAQFLHSNR